jgi:hypothetical protein
MMPPIPPPPPPRLAGPVAALLRAARDAERQASGPDRRAAFRLTRVLLGGARAAGHNAAQLAACLGLTANAVRDRCGSDGWVRVTQLSAVSGVPEPQWAQWHEAGQLTQHCRDDAGQDCYLASEVIGALSRQTAGSADGA